VRRRCPSFDGDAEGGLVDRVYGDHGLDSRT
jgi:hypothetical protein